MSRIIDIQVSPEILGNESELRKVVSKNTSQDAEFRFRIIRRSIDARQRSVKFNLRIEVFSIEEKISPLAGRRDFPLLTTKQSVVVVGAGPAGLFAALRLIEKGIRPIVLERGKDVQARRRDLAAIHKNHIVNANSN
ncbi:MAG: FAD-dependent monooxygenase, partial [Crocinitomicaceae bacterium]|nr:FAD-dependent monooxygenase [Crocinitomicaceae bacterium]